MATYLVTWDLNKEGALYAQARKNLIDAIDVYPNRYKTSLDSVRFVATSKDANQLYEDLSQRGRLDANDTLLVVKMEKSASQSQGDLGQDLWAWINA